MEWIFKWKWVIWKNQMINIKLIMLSRLGFPISIHYQCSPCSILPINEGSLTWWVGKLIFQNCGNHLVFLKSLWKIRATKVAYVRWLEIVSLSKLQPYMVGNMHTIILKCSFQCKTIISRPICHHDAIER